MTEITERALFIMPDDPELLWAAAACVQQYVNGHAMRAAQYPTAGEAKFSLIWDIRVDGYYWDLILRAGLQLKTDPGPFTQRPDTLIDLSVERLRYFEALGKHVSAAAGILAGVPSPALPVVTQPRLGEGWYAEDDSAWDAQEFIGMATRGTLAGVVGRAGFITYAAAAMGLAVLEYIGDRRRTWMSKYSNPRYRVIKPGDDVERMKRDTMIGAQWQRQE